MPIDVLGQDAIENSGQTETNRILNDLVPSFNFPQPSITDGSDAIRPATLRGLSPDQTLVLVNGKRRHVSALLNINGTVGRGSAAVDLNLIPGIAINRVEILRDGAAAQYGSDAIAGVINIQLKNTNHGGRASVTWGEYLTTVNDVLRVTSLRTDAAGQPILDPTNNIYFLANTDGDRHVQTARSSPLQQTSGCRSAPRVRQPSGEYHLRQPTNRAGYDLRPNYLRPTATTFDPRELRSIGSSSASAIRARATSTCSSTAGTKSATAGALRVRLIWSPQCAQRSQLAPATQQRRNRDWSTLTPTRCRLPPTTSA